MESDSTLDHALHHLDKGIERAVMILRDNGVNTVESCEGGPGHAFPDPTIVFSGGKAEGYRALSVALHHGLAVMQLRRVWPVIDYEPTGPYWELTFFPAQVVAQVAQAVESRAVEHCAVVA